MALISTSTTDNIGSPAGQFVGLALTDVNLRSSHTIMVRVKSSSTATNYDSVCVGYTAQSDYTGSFLGRANGNGGTLLNWRRQAAWFSYTQDNGTAGTAYGNTSTWYHIALVYNATTGQIRKYINGVFISQHASSTTRPSSSTANYFAIGAHPGKHADAAIFDRALSDAEVASMAAYRVPQVTSGLRIFWRLDSDASDSSGNGNNGSTAGSGAAVSYSTADNPPQPETPVINSPPLNLTSASTLSVTARITKRGTVALTSASTISASALVSKVASAALTSASSLSVAAQVQRLASATLTSASTLSITAQVEAALEADVALTTASQLSMRVAPYWGAYFDGSVGASLFRTALPMQVEDPVTYMAWIRLDASSDDFGTVQLYHGAYDARIQVYRNAGDNYVYFTYNNDAAADYGQVLANTDWHHFTITYDGSTYRYYIDATEVDSNTLTVATETMSGQLVLNANSNGYGEIAQVKVWSKALTPAEILSESQYHTPHNQLADLLAWYQLRWQNINEDQSGNGYDFSGTVAVGLTQSPGVLPPPYIPAQLNTTSASTLSLAAVVTRTASAALTSASTISASALVNKAASATLTSASTLSMTALVSRTAVVPLVSTSALSMAAVVTRTAAVGLASASTLDITARVAVVAAAGLTSSSSLSMAASLNVSAAATLTSASTLSMTALVARTAAVGLTSASSLSLEARLQLNAAAALVTASSFSMTAVVERRASAALTTASSLSISTNVLRLAALPMVSASTFTIATGNERLAVIGLDSASTLSIAAVVERFATVALNTTSTLNIDARVTRYGAVALNTVSALSAAAVVEKVAAAALTTASALSMSAIVEGSVGVGLVSASTLSFDARVAVVAAAGLTSSSHFTISATVIKRAALSMLSVSTLSVSVSVQKLAALTLLSGSSLSATASVTKHATLSLSSSSSLTVAASQEQLAVMHLTSTSSITVAAVGGIAVVPISGTGWLNSAEGSTNAASHSTWKADIEIGLQHSQWLVE